MSTLSLIDSIERAGSQDPAFSFYLLAGVWTALDDPYARFSADMLQSLLVRNFQSLAIVIVMAETIADCEAEAPKPVIEIINEEIASILMLAHTMNNRLMENESVLRTKLEIMEGLLDRLLEVCRQYHTLGEFILTDFRVEMEIFKAELLS